eukprot:2922573-Pleurochrysis_carterae.AAC.1
MDSGKKPGATCLRGQLSEKQPHWPFLLAEWPSCVPIDAAKGTAAHAHIAVAEAREKVRARARLSLSLSLSLSLCV